MTKTDRVRIRKLQDRFLTTSNVVLVSAIKGDNWPLFEGGPTIDQLRRYLYPEWENTLRTHIK